MTVVAHRGSSPTREGRQPLQWFIGMSQWDARPLRAELSQQIGQELGDPEGVLVFDPSSFSKSGKVSVGVARQGCGRLGKMPSQGQGRAPNRPSFRVEQWLATQPTEAWTTVDMRDAAKGPLIVEILKHRVTAQVKPGQPAPEEVLVVIRYKDRDNRVVVKTDYDFSNAKAATPLSEFARAAKVEQRIEECLQREKSEAGLGDYEVRNWISWNHHQTLFLLASRFF